MPSGSMVKSVTRISLELHPGYVQLTPIGSRKGRSQGRIMPFIIGLASLVRSTTTGAAWTYVAAALATLLDVARWFRALSLEGVMGAAESAPRGPSSPSIPTCSSRAAPAPRRCPRGPAPFDLGELRVRQLRAADQRRGEPVDGALVRIGELRVAAGEDRVDRLLREARGLAFADMRLPDVVGRANAARSPGCRSRPRVSTATSAC